MHAPKQPKLAIITGAGGGVGRGATEALAAAGYDLVLVGRTRATLESSAHAAIAAGAPHPPLVIPADVTDPQAVRNVVDQARHRFGRVDALVNVAGDAPLGPIEQLTPEAWRQCIDTNLSSVVYMTRAVWPVFQAQKSGVIVNISSMSSIDPFTGFSMYAAAKAGVNMFTHCTGQEGEAIGVKAVALVLGAVETAMLRRLFSYDMIPPDKAYSTKAIGEAIRDCITGDRDFDNGGTIVLNDP